MTKRSTVALPTGTFSYLQSGHGEPLMFLHALGRDASDWLPVMEALEHKYMCIALDQRGHGESVRPGEYSFELLEQDFRDFVDALDLGRFALVAHSMGGTVGWIFAERTPKRLSALIIEDTPVPVEEDFYPAVDESPSEEVGYDWEARRQLFRQLNSPDPSWRSNVARVTVPTMVIDGSGSEELIAIARALPHGEHVAIEVGHWVHEFAPEVFIRTIREFLGRVNT